MSNAFTEKRMTSLEISMSDLKELVAETSRHVARSSIEMSHFMEEMKNSREAFRTDMNDFLKNTIPAYLLRHQLTTIADLIRRDVCYEIQGCDQTVRRRI